MLLASWLVCSFLERAVDSFFKPRQVDHKEIRISLQRLQILAFPWKRVRMPAIVRTQLEVSAPRAPGESFWVENVSEPVSPASLSLGPQKAAWDPAKSRRPRPRTPSPRRHPNPCSRLAALCLFPAGR